MSKIPTPAVVIYGALFVVQFLLKGQRKSSFEGYGTQTRGGLDGRIIKVTNLNADGPGSFKEAIEAEGPRVVVFEVGGVIDLEKQ